VSSKPLLSAPSQADGGSIATRTCGHSETPGNAIARPVTNADFTDKVVEVTETAEEAVVSKSAQVKEEVVIQKEANERTETVRDTVRREDVEITKEPGVERPASTPNTVPAAPERKI
jgi:stress response protein YsnF